MAVSIAPAYKGGRSAPRVVAMLELGDVCLKPVSQLCEPWRKHLASKTGVVKDAPVERARLTIGENELANLARVPTLERSSQCFDVVAGFALCGIQATKVEQRAEVRHLCQLDPLVAEGDYHELILSRTRREAEARPAGPPKRGTTPGPHEHAIRRASATATSWSHAGFGLSMRGRMFGGRKRHRLGEFS